MSEVIVFCATVYKVQTLTDNGIRVALDLPEYAIAQMAQLAECQRVGVVLQVSAERLLNNTVEGEGNAISKRAKRQSRWTTRKETGAN